MRILQVDDWEIMRANFKVEDNSKGFIGRYRYWKTIRFYRKKLRDVYGVYPYGVRLSRFQRFRMWLKCKLKSYFYRI